jgi:hypothetical protein
VRERRLGVARRDYNRAYELNPRNLTLRRWPPIRPLGCSSGGSRPARLYLHCRACQVRVSRWNPRGSRPELPRGLRAGRHRPGTRCPFRPGVTGGQGVRAASEPGQADGRGRQRSRELRLRGPVRSRHQAARLRGIGTDEVDCRQYATRCSPRPLRGGLIRSEYARSRDRAARGALAELLERQRIAPHAAGRRFRHSRSRRVRRNDHETQPPILPLSMIVEPR